MITSKTAIVADIKKSWCCVLLSVNSTKTYN